MEENSALTFGKVGKFFALYTFSLNQDTLYARRECADAGDLNLRKLAANRAFHLRRPSCLRKQRLRYSR